MLCKIRKKKTDYDHSHTFLIEIHEKKIPSTVWSKWAKDVSCWIASGQPWTDLTSALDKGWCLKPGLKDFHF